MFTDPGCHLAIDLLARLGLHTRMSCEGHPRGAYLGLARDEAFPPGVAAALRRGGWTVAEGGSAAYMAPVADVAARDASWRRVCRELAALRAGPRGRR